LIVPVVVVVVWLAGVVATTDLAVPPARGRSFKQVLAVFAHADDETINCGGAIHRLATTGSVVTLILLTAGERGNSRGVPDSELKAIRGREAQHAARILGVSKLIQKDFGDGQLMARREDVKAYLSRTISEIAPDLVLTHDLSGVYGHPDHVACAEILIELRTARFTNMALWCVVLPWRVVRLMKLGRQLRPSPGAELRMDAPTLRIFVGRGLVAKIRAWYSYRSQRRSIAKGFGRFVPIWFAASMLQFEYFAEVA
jgi:LmbE family N-acetylglucosaminyl deacetylase